MGMTHDIRDIRDLRLEGKTDQEIAEILGISLTKIKRLSPKK